MSVKTALLAVMANLMIFFLIAGAQTLDYNIMHNLPIPWQVWALFAASVVWGLLLRRMIHCWRDELERFVDRLNDED